MDAATYSMPPATEYDWEVDSYRCWQAFIAEMRRRHLAGEDVASLPYFRRTNASLLLYNHNIVGFSPMPLSGDRKREVDRAAQKRWRERLKADSEKYEAFKKRERRRSRIRQQQDPEYAEHHRQQNRERYHNDPSVRDRAKQRRELPENRQRSRALRCLSKGLSANLPDQLKIVRERLERLLKQIEET